MTEKMTKVVDSAILEIENKLYGLKCMVRISERLLEDTCFGKHIVNDDGYFKVLLNDDERNDLAFCYGDIFSRVKKLEAEFDKMKVLTLAKVTTDSPS